MEEGLPHPSLGGASAYGRRAPQVSRVAGHEQLDAAPQVTPEDLEAERTFWAYWGTPVFRAMLNAKAEPEKRRNGPS